MTRRRVSMLGIVALVATMMVGGAAAEDAARVLPVGGTVGVELVAEGLTSPVWLGDAGDGSGRLFVADQSGLVRVIAPDGTMLDEPFLDLRDRMVALSPSFDERGLLGVAFHPGFATNGRFFVSYSAPLRPGGPDGFNHTSHVSEFQVSETDPDRADDGSERILLQVDQPQFNHNAGDLAFGPDGYLYIALGDGGGANDVGHGHTPGLGNGQDATNLLGAILRIDVDVDGDDPYAIPADNPFIGTTARDEIFAYGFRNPWRFTFDPDGELGMLAADAGQNLWNEVNVVERGGNFGWNLKEGTHCFDPDEPFVAPDDCPATGPLFGDALTDPVIEYPNIRHPDVEGVGLVVIGGRVYRGGDLPQLHGRYVFADWSTSFNEPDGTLLVAKPRSDRLWKLEELRVAGHPGGRLGHFVLGFGQDPAGEVYVLTSDQNGPTGDSGRVYRLSVPLSAAEDGPRSFVAPLSGAQEVPPVDTDATGLARFQLSHDGTELSYRLVVANIENVTQAHIHLGARGVNGPVVAWLHPSGPPPMLIEGRTDGTLATGTITSADLVGPLAGQSLDDLVELLRAGDAYVNVHTSQHPPGEIRGQIDRPRGHLSGG